MSSSDAEARQLQRIADYKKVFSGDAGARVLEDLCQYTQFQTPSFDENEDTSGRKMAFREGQRSVIAFILAQTEMARAEFQKKVRDAYQKTEEDE